jgi:uncharacterized protein (TIGR00369 family)
MSDTVGPVPDDASLHERIRRSFERQGLMAHLGARLTEVSPGQVRMELPARTELTQQHGYLHGGAVAALADSAGACAALTLLPEGLEVLTTGYAIDYLAPARGAVLEAVATVLKSGRTLTVCRIEVHSHAHDGGRVRLVAAVQQTLVATTAAVQPE